MTAFDGWVHDKYNSKYMLIAETLMGVLFVIISLVVLDQLKKKNKLLPHTLAAV